ncbi:dienelactone hydrolase family protein [Paenibacillus rigui]|uniref:Dienelactone hydrolase n=1 Tax=Paenibacillus rigui TaxID=554312 RepID=A0A229UXA0_9BACL|nr:alpha/beta hydrolase family protein [Paenibacillus rigui]OXM87983.1 dienelactone hydrolase [Paenibacillus rigui]
MWGPEHYLDYLYEQEEASEAITGLHSKPWQERKHDVRAALLRSLGPLPNERVALKPTVLETMDQGEYTMERVSYTTAHALQATAYVLIPKGLQGKAPAVMAWHGHGYGSREVVGLLPDGKVDESIPGIHQHFGVQLVRRGMVVIAPDVIGFGDRRLPSDRVKDPRKNSSCAPLAARLLLYGRTLAGLRVYEALRAVDYAVTREEVDTDRIGSMGFSGGGLIASMSAVLDERIRATVLSAFTSTFRGSLLAMSHCIDNYFPAILPGPDLPELIGLAAPRGLFVESGTEDPLFPVASVREAIDCLAAIYDAEKAADRFGTDLFQGKHEVSGRHSYDWLVQQLKA